MSYFVEDLLESIKKRSLAPIAQSTFSDANLISLATEVMQGEVVPELMKLREDFFLAQESTSLIASVANYSIPRRAIGTSLKEIFFVATGTSKKIPLDRVDSERTQDYEQSGPAPEKFFLFGDEVVLLPAPSLASGSLVMNFPAMPNNLAATSACAEIQSSASGASTTTFTVDTDLTGTLAAGSYVDFLSTVAPFKLWSYRVAIVSITATTIEVATSSIANEAGTVEPQAFDYICPSGTANIPQIPIVYHPVLSQGVVVRLMESLGDLNKLAAAKGTYAELKSSASVLVKNRVENSLKRITGRNQISRFFR